LAAILDGVHPIFGEMSVPSNIARRSILYDNPHTLSPSWALLHPSLST
jgi:hypothetical protein